jgi:hypothetical protein
LGISELHGVHFLLRQPLSIPIVAKWFRKFGQFTRAQSPALLALACGYLFDALIMITRALTFPVSLHRKGYWGRDRKPQPDYSFGTADLRPHDLVLLVQGADRTCDRPCVGQGAGHNCRAWVSQLGD